MKLRIFTDSAWFRAKDQLCPLLLPWGAEFTDPHRLRFFEDRYTQTGSDYFTRSGAAECDLIICPTLWQEEHHSELVRRLAGEANRYGKPLVVFCESDSEAPFPVAGVRVFRGSLRRTRRLPTEYAAPAFIKDHLHVPTPALGAGPRAKAAQPVVGFCGCVDTAAGSRTKQLISGALNWGLLSRPGLERWLRRCGLRLTRSEGKRARYQAIGVVSRCSGLRKNLVLRDQFLNGTLQLPKDEQGAHWRNSFQEFRQNVLASDYTLCPRGGGNWSYRLYETLCLGRIPVFFDTDCVLPYESLVNWRDYCVWVGGEELDQTAEAILEHYRGHAPEAYADFQRRCRQLWEDYLSLDGFFRNFHRHPELLDPAANRSRA